MHTSDLLTYVLTCICTRMPTHTRAHGCMHTNRREITQYPSLSVSLAPTHRKRRGRGWGKKHEPGFCEVSQGLDETALNQGLNTAAVFTQLFDGDDGRLRQRPLVLVPQSEVEYLIFVLHH